METRKIIIATNNKGKAIEFKRVLEPFGFNVITQAEAGILSNPEETGATFAENAEIKAKTLFEHIKTYVVADDSGLVIDALPGLLGVHSARFEPGKDYIQKCEKILALMKDVPKHRRAARFISALYLITPDGETKQFTGICEGYIGDELQGENGFGFDPVFYINGKSFASLSAEEKDAVSHRGKALRALADEIGE